LLERKSCTRAPLELVAVAVVARRLAWLLVADDVDADAVNRLNEKLRGNLQEHY